MPGKPDRWEPDGSAGVRLLLPRRFAAVLLVCLSCAAPARPGLAVGTGHYQAEITLAPGDRIAVTVLGVPEISGEMLVDSTGSIVMAPVGRIAVADLTIKQCEQEITRRLADGFYRHPYVAVRLAESRPIYVLGDVRSPGSLPFRYGATVLSAVASAGGFRVPQQPEGDAEAEFLSADQRVRQLESQRSLLLVRKARLEAQQSEQAHFTLPKFSSESRIRITSEMISAEQATLTARLDSLREQLSLIDQQKPRIQTEIVALQQQTNAARTRLNVVNEEVSQAASNLKQGLGLRSVEVNMKLEQASQEGRLWQIIAEISRLQMEAGDLDIRAARLRAQFCMQAVTDLQGVQDQLAELRTALPLVIEISEIRRRAAERASGTDHARTISITRTNHGTTTTFEAEESSSLQPGDVVNIISVSDSKHLAQSISSDHVAARRD